MPVAASPHDAQKGLTDPRDQLARHDKPIAFFFGAGTSCSVRVPTGGGAELSPLIPAVAGLTELCRSAVGQLGEKFSEAWALIKLHCEAKAQSPHIENILS